MKKKYKKYKRKYQILKGCKQSKLYNKTLKEIVNVKVKKGNIQNTYTKY